MTKRHGKRKKKGRKQREWVASFFSRGEAQKSCFHRCFFSLSSIFISLSLSLSSFSTHFSDLTFTTLRLTARKKEGESERERERERERRALPGETENDGGCWQSPRHLCTFLSSFTWQRRKREKYTIQMISEVVPFHQVKLVPRRMDGRRNSWGNPPHISRDISLRRLQSIYFFSLALKRGHAGRWIRSLGRSTFFSVCAKPVLSFFLLRAFQFS